MLLARPRLRMYLRMLAVGGLEGFVNGVAESIIRERSLGDSLVYAQSYAAQYMLFFGIAYAILAVIVTLVFDYEPNPRRFKRAMALALLPLAFILAAPAIQNVMRYSSSYYLSDLLHSVTHVVVIAWLSQFVANKYLREVSVRSKMNDGA